MLADQRADVGQQRVTFIPTAVGMVGLQTLEELAVLEVRRSSARRTVMRPPRSTVTVSLAVSRCRRSSRLSGASQFSRPMPNTNSTSSSRCSSLAAIASRRLYSVRRAVRAAS